MMSEAMEEVLGLAEQLRWGSRVDPPSVVDDRPIVLLGMGGSGMAARVGALGADPSRMIAVHSSYGLPGWAAPSGALVVAVSYSGNTEETVSGIGEALAKGLPIAAVTSGGTVAELAKDEDFALVSVPAGHQPRVAVGYQAAGVLAVLEAAGAIVDAAAQLGRAAEVVAATLDDGAGPGYRLGLDIADALAGRISVIYGGHGPAALAAYRWKTQINENAKMPAFAGEVPELNHNELEGWSASARSTSRSVGLVYLRDRHDHPRVAKRLDLTAKTIQDQVSAAGQVYSEGVGPLERFFSLAVVGDVASIAMAESAGVDAGPVDVLEGLKRQLRGADS
jgi:glucose/mannose-6-phosphate isomerase